MPKSQKTAGRRGFLKAATAGAAALAASPALKAQQGAAARPVGAPPTAAQRAAENTVSAADIQIIEQPGSDFMADVFNSLGIEYLFANPGSSFRGLHESLINHSNNKPEFITLDPVSTIRPANSVRPACRRRARTSDRWRSQRPSCPSDNSNQPGA